MQNMFAALLELIKAPIRPDRGIKTDNSILLIYPPDRELDFREHLLDTFVPELDAKGIPYRLVDLTGFLFVGSKLFFIKFERQCVIRKRFDKFPVKNRKIIVV